MEPADVARMLARYRWLILAFVAIGLGIAAISHVGESKTYTASARLLLDTADPESRAESTAIADTAKAIATSPARVDDALTRARVAGRDPSQMARESVSVRALGSSGVIQISVRDQSPDAAARIANALAAEVIDTRLSVTTGQSRRVLQDLDRRIGELDRRIAVLEARTAALALAAENASDAVAANAIRRQADEAERARDLLAQRRSAEEAQRVNLLSTEAERPRPSIISRATPPETADASRLLVDGALGAIVGLILGIGIAGLFEMLRPTVGGSRAVARAFDAPLLGTIRAAAAAEGDPTRDAGTAARLAATARAADVTDVMLLPIAQPLNVDAVAERLQAHVAAAVSPEQSVFANTRAWTVRGSSTAPAVIVGGGSGIASDTRPSLGIRPFGVASVELQSRDHSGGVVVVAPTVVGKAELGDAIAFVRGTSLPLLGVIAIERSWAPLTAPGRSLIQALKRRRTAE